jgi:hypothetical protein
VTGQPANHEKLTKWHSQNIKSSKCIGFSRHNRITTELDGEEIAPAYPVFIRRNAVHSRGTREDGSLDFAA